MIDKETKELCKRLDQINKSINDLNKTIKSFSVSAELMAGAYKRLSEAYGKSIAEKNWSY